MESKADGEHWDTLFSLLSISVEPISTAAIIALCCMGILLIFSSLVSGSETAYFSLDKSTLQQLDESKPGARRILNLLERPRLLLATILIANNFFNIGFVILSAFVLTDWLGFGMPGSEVSPLVEFLISVLLVTFILVLLGEVTPKIYANYHNLSMALAVSGLLMVLRYIFKPLAITLVHSTRVIERRLANHSQQQVTKEEVDHAIDLATDDSTSPEKKDILRGIVKFSDITVKQIMHPRMDIVAINVEVSFKEVLDIVLDSGFSRIPVYRDNLDYIEGILYVKDLLKYLDTPDDFDWSQLLRRAYFVPETKKIEQLLKEFQQEHIHLAIAVDEYGGTSGIITLEDIMEEIIGEIKDEYDEHEELEYEKISDKEFVFEGKTLINDLCKVVNVKTDYFDEVKGDADSVAGMMLELFQRMPKPKDVMTYKAFRFEVLTLTKKRIKRVKVTLLEDHDET